jgi:hypothetical protein
MAHQLTMQVKTDNLNRAWNPSEALAEAMAERALFLNKHPEYRSFQREIDRLLEKAGHSENRMTVLAVLMEAKLVELHTQLKRLNAILMRIGTSGGHARTMNS